MLNLVVLQAGCFPRRAVQVVGWLLAGDNFQQTLFKLSANSHQLLATLLKLSNGMKIRMKSDPKVNLGSLPHL